MRACHESVSPNCDGIARTHCHFFSATASIPTTMLGVERLRILEAVRVVHEDRVARGRRRVGHEERRHDHDRGVVHQHARVAVIRVVVVRPVAHDDVGLPVANEPGHRAAVLERRHQLAVVDVEHLGLDAEDPRALRDFRLAPLRQRPAGALEVADVAVGHRDELHLVPGGGPQRRHAARLQLGVVRVRAEGDDPQRTRRGVARRLDGGRGRQGRGDGRARRQRRTLASRSLLRADRPPRQRRDGLGDDPVRRRERRLRVVRRASRLQHDDRRRQVAGRPLQRRLGGRRRRRRSRRG